MTTLAHPGERPTHKSQGNNTGNLVTLLRCWRVNGDIVVLMMDANEHVINGALFKQLSGNDLKIHDVAHCQVCQLIDPPI